MDPSLALGALLITSCAYYAAALAALAQFRRRGVRDLSGPDSCPGVSVLKPAVGAGREFGALLRSHAEQDHPSFEILVGAEAGNEAVREAVRRIQGDFPSLRLELIVCPSAAPHQNGKVEVLQRLGQHARNAVLVATDADIGVPNHHLRTLCAHLEEAGAGMATCLYRALPGRGLASRLEALWINTDFPGQVVLARALQGMRFALGSTLALRAETLDSVGGFESLRGFIGDDYQLGARVAAHGLGVELAALPVSTHLPDGDGWKQAWHRQLRWSRTIRMQRPAGHAGLFVTFAVLWAGLALLAEPLTLWPLAAAALGLRFASAASSARVLGGGLSIRDVGLLPVADLGASGVWLCSFFGSSVSWAGRRMRLGPGGRILG